MPVPLAQKYFPAFSTREAELRAYSELPGTILDRMVPVITLTREREAPSLEASLAAVAAVANGRPIIVDFDPIPRDLRSEEEIEAERARKAEQRRRDGKKPFVPTEKHKARWQQQRDTTIAFNDSVEALKDGAGGYANWRMFCLPTPTVIPVIQAADPTQVLPQVRAIVAADRRIAFRIDVRDPLSVGAFLIAAPVLDRADRAIVILDAGHIRGSVAGAQELVTKTLKGIQDNVPPALFQGLLKVCMAGSFPNVLTTLLSPLEIQERELFDLVVAEGWDVRYGDHASVQPRRAQGGANGWLPHVEMAHPRRWYFERSNLNSDKKGYIDSAKLLVGNAVAWSGRSTSWGTDMVERASRGLLNDGGTFKLTTPGRWVGPRVSQHLTQQALHP